METPNSEKYVFKTVEGKWQRRWAEGKPNKVTADPARKKYYVLEMGFWSRSTTGAGLPSTMTVAGQCPDPPGNGTQDVACISHCCENFPPWRLRSRFSGDGQEHWNAPAFVVMAGAELGLPPFASMSGIHIIQGKPVLGANILATLVKNDPGITTRSRGVTMPPVS